ncbi:phage distal tail protein [Actinoplanes sp. NPDC049668]|uniref:phage distal tail protein n=1 Tax=unclassified Actinoplanes TaxID=2626549 RepID=UPI0033B5B2FD
MPINLVKVSNTQTEVVIGWDESTGGPSYYQVYLDNVYKGTGAVGTRRFTFAGLTPGGSYNAQVASVDSSGNVSAKSDILVVQTAVPIASSDSFTSVEVVTERDFSVIEAGLFSDAVLVRGYSELDPGLFAEEASLGVSGSGANDSGAFFSETADIFVSKAPITSTYVQLVDGDLVLDIRKSTLSVLDPIAMRELDLGYPSFREVRTDAVGQDGEVDLTQRYGARTVSMQLRIMNRPSQSISQTIDQISAMVVPFRRPYMYVERPGWIDRRKMRLRPNPLSYAIVKESLAYIDLSLSFSCPSGVMEAIDPSTATIFALDLRTGIEFTSSGMAATSDGVVVSPGNAENEREVWSYGNVSTPVLLRAYGPFTSFAVRNKLSGRKLGFTGLNLTAGHYIEVDVANRTAYVDSDPDQSVYGNIDWAGGSTWFSLAPGPNPLVFESTGGTPDTRLFAMWADRWL